MRGGSVGSQVEGLVGRAICVMYTDQGVEPVGSDRRQGPGDIHGERGIPCLDVRDKLDAVLVRADWVGGRCVRQQQDRQGGGGEGSTGLEHGAGGLGTVKAGAVAGNEPWLQNVVGRKKP